MPSITGVYSGRYGSVGGQKQALNWTIESTMSDNAHANSATRAGKRRDEGVMDWTGSVTLDGPMDISAGLNSFTFNGYTGAPTLSGGGISLSGSAQWTSIAISADYATNGRLQVQASFGGDGPLSWQNAGSSPQDTPGMIITAKDISVSWNNNPVAVQNFNFTITNEVQTYVGSDTVEGGHVWTRRFPGLFDCTGSLTLKHVETMPVQGTVAPLVITAGNYVILEMPYVRYLSTSGIGANPNTGELVGYTGNFGLCAHDDSGALGHVKLFNTMLWPEGATAN